MDCIAALLALWAVAIIMHIQRHTSSVEECFQMALLIGIASSSLPSALFLIPLIWLYLIYQNLFSLRSFIATFLGLLTVAVYVVVAIWMGWIDNSWADFFAIKNLWAWIPTGSFLIAWIASTIVRRNLRVR